MHKFITPLHRLSISRQQQQTSTLRFITTIKTTQKPFTPLACHPRCLSTLTPVLQQQQHNNSTKPPLSKQQDQDQEELETIDPKDYPELYPELEKQQQVDTNDEQIDEEEEMVDTEWFVEDEGEQDENFVPLWQRRAVGDHLHGRWAMQEASKRLIDAGDLTPENIQALLEENKMDHVQVLDVRGNCDWTDYMVVAESDKGDRFLSNVAEQIRQTVNKAIRENPAAQDELTAPHIEGRDDQSGWVLIDLGSCVVHLFTPEVRQHYDLEGLWIPNNKEEES
ncbi:Oligomerization domain-containing protein [Phascolomyces articulosus]|uniref:Oligomerization domain-containing protein n=1 Tax=Phascolomyces articulosus TaxID=60185 RepID=A0AAD5K5T4_9FUNG|nr:Oligomerization domain-containing protein [Phascolomyces articulosus]